jgi:uncharacterized protein involved in response to NO
MQNRQRSIQLFCEEPFRVFFPIGLLLGIVGVSLWPLYYAGLVSTYPGTVHARLMVEGFMASFIIGFLGTAGPRITSTSHFSRGELITLLTLDLLSGGLHFGGSSCAGDALFALCLVFFLFVIGKRFVQRKDSPPPNFALVGLGLLNGIAGAGLLALFENEAYSVQYRIGAALLEQGLVLLLILGVAPFFLARLLNLPPADLMESRELPAGWIWQAAFAATVGLIVDGTFVAEAFDPPAVASWVRLGVVVVYLITRMTWRGRSFLGDSFARRNRRGSSRHRAGSALATVQDRRAAHHIHQRIQLHRADGGDPRDLWAQRQRTVVPKTPAVFHHRSRADFPRDVIPLRR